MEVELIEGRSACRELFDFVVDIDNGFRTGNHRGFLIERMGVDSFSDFLDVVSGFFDGATEELERANFRKVERNNELSERLDSIRKDIVDQVVVRWGGATKSPLIRTDTIERLRGITEQAENTVPVAAHVVSRREMISETELMLEEVQKWNIDPYAKKTLIIQLTAITRIIQEADKYREAELRRRVKGVIADFASEYGRMDDEYLNRLERLKLWGRKTVFGGAFFLGLVADTTTVAGALPPPPPQIESSGEL